MRERLRSALTLVAERLPGRDLILYTRSVDDDRRITWISGEVERITGHPIYAFTKDPHFWPELIDPEDRQTVVSHLADIEGKELIELDYRINTPSGRTVWIRDELRVLRSRDGRPTELLGVMRDITLEKELEVRAGGLEHRLFDLSRLSSTASLASSLAHDFDILMSAIESSAQALAGELELGPQAAQELIVIREAARRGATLARQILSFGTSPATAGDEPLDSYAALSETRSLVARAMGPSVHFTMELEPGLRPLGCGRARLQETLVNLVLSARTRTGDSGAVKILAVNHDASSPFDVLGGVLSTGAYVRIAVTDDGTAVSEEEWERLLDPLSLGGGEGAEGLGLWTMAGLAKELRGGLRVGALGTLGTKVEVFLPVGKDSSSSLVGAVVAASGSAKGGRILLVEDDVAVRATVARLLETEGHLVIQAGSTEEGVRIFDRVRPPFDLLLTDVILPDRPGPELHRALRRKVPDLPAVFMSGYGDEIAHEQLDAGAVLLKKPFTPDALRSLVRAALEKGGESRAVGGTASGGE